MELVPMSMAANFIVLSYHSDFFSWRGDLAVKY
jgi:hypothetical protein